MMVFLPKEEKNFGAMYLVAYPLTALDVTSHGAIYRGFEQNHRFVLSFSY